MSVPTKKVGMYPMSIKHYHADWHEDLDKLQKWGFRHCTPSHYARDGVCIHAETGEEVKPKAPEKPKSRDHVVEEVDRWEIAK